MRLVYLYEDINYRKLSQNLYGTLNTVANISRYASMDMEK